MFNDLLALPGYATAVFGPDARLLRANLAFLKLFRYPSMPHGLEAAELATPRDREQFDRNVRSLFFGQPWPFSASGFVCADGSSFLMECQALLLYDKGLVKEAALLWKAAVQPASGRLEQFQASILDQMQDGVFVVDRNVKVLYWNSVSELLFDLPSSAALGRTGDFLPFHRILGDAFHQVEADVTARLSGEWEVRPGRWVAYEIGGWFSPDGPLEGLICLCRDVTARKSLEAELKESELFYRAMFEQSPLAMLIYDVESLRVLEANDAACRFYEYPRARFTQLSMYDLRPDDERQRFAGMLDQIRQGQRTRELQTGTWIHLSGSGRLMHVEVLSHAVAYHGHNARLVVVRDISSERLQSKRLRESENRLKMLFENTEEMIVLYDRNLRVVLFNSRVEQGLKSSEGTDIRAGMSLDDFMRPDDARFWKTLLEKALQGESTRLEHKHIDAAGNTFYVSATVQPLLDDQRVIGVAVFTKDLSELRRREYLLENSSRIARIGGWELNLISRQLIWSDTVYDIHETERGRTVTLEEAIGYYTEADRPRITAVVEHLMKTSEPFDDVFELITAKGNRRIVRAIGECETAGNRPVLIKGTVQDITEQELHRRERDSLSSRLEAATGAARIGVWETYTGEPSAYWSRMNFELHGAAPAPDNRMPVDIINTFLPEDRDRIIAAHAEAVAAGGDLNVTFSLPNETGIRHFRSVGKPKFGPDGGFLGFIGITQDITADVETRRRIEDALKERETLLAEIHHRVKNNFTVITSLLGLHIQNSEDPSLKSILSESRKRIMSMALVHEKLYQTRSFSSVDFDSYLQELIPLVMTGFERSGTDIRIHAHAKGISLDIVRAVPFGLMIHELMSNSLKHAFTGRLFGEIRIEISATETGLRFDYKDDGPGFDFYDRLRSSETLGLILINLLARQLGGTLAVLPGPGLHIRLELHDRPQAG